MATWQVGLDLDEQLDSDCDMALPGGCLKRSVVACCWGARRGVNDPGARRLDSCLHSESKEAGPVSLEHFPASKKFSYYVRLLAYHNHHNADDKEFN